jgi:FlaA1/EpsC-like NDP-sugar epimerase
MTHRLNWRASLAFVHDVCMAAIAWVTIYSLRFNLEVREPFLTDMWATLACVLPLQAGIFLALGLYRGLWRFASLPDLQRIMLAAGLGAILIPLVLVMLKLQTAVPRSAATARTAVARPRMNLTSAPLRIDRSR